MKTLKQSSSDVRVVTDGLKSTVSPLSRFALAFFSFRLWVRVRSSLWLGAMGFSFQASPSSRLLAVVAHLCGFLQPFSLSLLQSSHWHRSQFWWVGLGLRSRLVSNFRFFTLPALWVVFRQWSFSLLYAFGGVPRWNHVGRCFPSFCHPPQFVVRLRFC